MRWMSPLIAIVVCTVAAAVLAPSAHAESILLLEDGRILVRPKMEAVDGGVKVYFENGEVVVPDRLIEEAILSGVPTYEPKNDKEREKLEKGLVPWKGKWVKKTKLPDLIAKHVKARKEAVEELRKHAKWRHRHREKTKHFAFEYTIPPYVFEYYRDLLEAYYKDFAKTWKLKPPKDAGRLTVCCYADRQEFHQISGAPGGALAYFRFVKPIELNFYYDRLDPDGTEQVMYHEASHYLQMLMDPGFKMPHFPGEAIAEYYGASKFDPKTKKLETGLVLEGRLAEIKTQVLAGDMKGLEKMLTTDRDYDHYSWGWSLAHWLMSEKKTRKKFEKFVRDLVYAKDVKRVPFGAGKVTVPMDGVWAHFKKVFGLKTEDDVTAFEEAWHQYVRDGLKFVTGRGLEQAAKRWSNLGLDIKARRLYKEAIEAGSENPLTFHAYARLLEQKGSRQEALQYFRKAIELEPLESAFYASLASALFSTDEKEEGRRYGRLALEMAPDDVQLEWRMRWLLEDDEN